MKYSNNNFIKRVLVVSFIFIVLTLTVYKIGYKKLMGNVYNISDIDANIDKIKTGDTINYTGNGYSNWKVLYIDKENKTMDIISKDTLGEITLDGKDSYINALERFQEEADKYADGENAISARNITQSEMKDITVTDHFWTSDIAGKNVYYDTGVPIFLSIPTWISFKPVVTLVPNDSYSSLNVGDDFNIEINGVKNWFVFKKNSSTSISIIPKDRIELYSDENEYVCKDLPTLVENKLNQYKIDGVESVRCIELNDLTALSNLPQSVSENFLNNSFYAGNFDYFDETMNNYDRIKQKSFNYRFYYIYYASWNQRYQSSYSSCSEFSYTLGIRPIVTIKFSDKKVETKKLDNTINLGDYVDYEAKGYSNWKVLSINKNNNTVDVISGGVVKNLLLEGLDDYNNVEKILQSEVDEYKNGNRVISARSVNYSDFDNLRAINDKTKARYWTSNTYVYKSKRNPSYSYDMSSLKTYTNVLNDSVGIGYYNESTLEIEKEWAILYTDGSKDTNVDYLSPAASGPYTYLAGIRPVITLKLDEVKKVDESTTTKTNDESFITEQNKNNKTKTKVISGNISNSDGTPIKGSSITQNDSSIDGMTKRNANDRINILYNKYKSKIKFIIINFVVLNILITSILLKLFSEKINRKKTDNNK